MQGTLGRDKLAAQLWPGKSFLFDDKDARARGGQMDRGAAARGAATGDDYVIGVWLDHQVSLAVNSCLHYRC